MKGYDLDGTLCNKFRKRDKPYMKQNGIERKAYEELRRIHYMKADLLMRPEEPFIVITGRKELYRVETEFWLAHHRFDHSGLYMLQKGRSRENMIELKVEICKQYNVTVYYEDDKAIAKAMAKQGINVILVENK